VTHESSPFGVSLLAIQEYYLSEKKKMPEHQNSGAAAARVLMMASAVTGISVNTFLFPTNPFESSKESCQLSFSFTFDPNPNLTRCDATCNM